MPSPLGAPHGCFAKGQTDKPITQANQGEVPEKGRISKNIRLRKSVFCRQRLWRE